MQPQGHTSPPPFTLAPMGSQQFLHMAQNHAVGNSAYPPAAPHYLPLQEIPLEPLASYAPYYPAQQPPPKNNGFSQAPCQNYYALTPEQWNWHNVAAPQHCNDQESCPEFQPTPCVDPQQDLLHPSCALPPSVQSFTPSGYVQALAEENVADQDSNSRNCAVEKLSDDPLPDEYKWRKYGQKQVKGSIYPRNYYKCTIAGCSAKKHLEKFYDEQFSKERLRTIYLGQHVHPTPVSPHLFVSTQQDFRNNVLFQSNNIRQMSTVADKPTDALRLIIVCSAQVDENEDGYFWRKYGQKTVKGSIAPRQYYKCRNVDCTVKKQVEASTHGHTILTYEGAHNHEPGVIPDAIPLYRVPFNVIRQAQLQHMRNASQESAPESYVAVHYPPSPSYPAIDSPSSTLSTTEDEDDSYSSEPSPKRSKFIEPDQNQDQIHQYQLPASIPGEDIHKVDWDTAPYDFYPRYTHDYFLDGVVRD